MDKMCFLNILFLYFGLRFKVKALIYISLELIVTNAFREVIVQTQNHRIVCCQIRIGFHSLSRFVPESLNGVKRPRGVLPHMCLLLPDCFKIGVK